VHPLPRRPKKSPLTPKRSRAEHPKETLLKSFLFFFFFFSPPACAPHAFFVEHRGTGFAGPLVLPPAGGLAKRHEVREDWG